MPGTISIAKYSFLVSSMALEKNLLLLTSKTNIISVLYIFILILTDECDSYHSSKKLLFVADDYCKDSQLVKLQRISEC